MTRIHDVRRDHDCRRTPTAAIRAARSAEQRRTGARRTFVNADDIAREAGLDLATPGGVVTEIRKELVRQRESFIFESALSDPVGEMVSFLRDAAASGYTVVMCYIGISGADVSDARVAMRVSQGGHDVPAEKLPARYARSLANLKRATRDLPIVLVFDNDDLCTPYRRVAMYENGARTFVAKPVPKWVGISD